MGTYNLYIPSSTGSYKTPAGEIRLRIYYEGSGSGDTDFDSPAWFESNLKYDFSLKSDGTITLSNITLGFYNKDNIWETHGGSGVFAQATDYNKIFLDVIVDDDIFWSGVIDYLNVKKNEYRYESGVLTYNEIKIPWNDKVKMLETVTCGEAGIATGDSVSTILASMASELDFGATDYTYENFTFDEISGRRFGVRSAMPQNSLKVDNIDSSESCMTLLKRLSLGFGFMVYNYRDTLRIQDRDSSTFSALNAETHGYVIDVIEKKLPSKYVAVKGTKDWSVYNQVGGAYDLNLPSDTRRFSVGTESTNQSQNFVLDLTTALENIYYDAYSSGQEYTPGAAEDGFTAEDPATRPGEIKINNPALGIGYSDSGWEAESGMLAQINLKAGTDNKFRFFSVLTHWESEASVFYILANGKSASDVIESEDYITRIYRKTDSGQDLNIAKLYKIYPCLKTVCAIYAKALLGEKTLRVKQHNFRHVYLGFSFESSNYMILKMQYDFKNGTCEYEANAITSTPTVTASEDVAPNVNTVDAVDDGVHKVTASAIYNHINDKTIHWNHDQNGTSYAQLQTDQGNEVFLWIKEIATDRYLIQVSKDVPA